MYTAIQPRLRVLAFVSVLVLLLSTAGPAHADDAVDPSYEARVHRTTRGAMAVLAGWSAVNLVAGTVLGIASDDPVSAAFHQMNAGWNIVNAALAVPGLIGATRDLNAVPSGLTVAEVREEQNRLEDILLFNAGIDVGYMMAGLYLMERSRRGGSDAAMLDGFGRSLVVQGGFLFVFDLAVYVLQRRVAPGS